MLNEIEGRTHFAAWCIVSSPLVLGLDLTNKTNMDLFWPIISNKESIAVNEVRKTPFRSHFYTKNDHITKTGSGQT